jgi:DNA-binding GntR family transcriptional regulator
MTDLSTGGMSKYHRLAAELRREIQDGVYAPGDQLPSETQLVERFKVSQPTVRAAVAVLRAEGLVESVHGRGTFVRERRRLQRVSRNRYGRARADEQLLTSHLRHEITSAGRAPVPEEIAEIMGAEPGSEVIVRQRTLYDRETNQPVELGASYFSLQSAVGTYLEQPTVVPKALFLCVEELTGRRYTKARDRFTARMPSVYEATTFGISPGNPVLHVIHTAYDEDDNVLEVSESVWPADRIMVVDEYAIPQHPTGPDDKSDV